MFSIFTLIFLSLMIGIGAWLVFIWATKTGQFDDLEGPKFRMMEDDDEEGENENKQKG